MGSLKTLTHSINLWQDDEEKGKEKQVAITKIEKGDMTIGPRDVKKPNKNRIKIFRQHIWNFKWNGQIPRKIQVTKLTEEKIN